MTIFHPDPRKPASAPSPMRDLNNRARARTACARLTGALAHLDGEALELVASKLERLADAATEHVEALIAERATQPAPETADA